MTFATVGDVARAYDEGRVHTQRFVKTSGTSVQNAWVWWGQGAGAPAADFLVGAPGEFTPVVQTNQNKGIWPGVTTPSGFTKHLVAATISIDTGATTNQWESVILMDVLGYYPLVDGSIPDEQFMDNTLSLTRYTSGAGVRIFIMGQVSATSANGNGTITYIDDTDTQRTVPLRTITQVNNLGQAAPTAAATTEGGNWVALASGSKGVKRIVSLNFGTSQPQGLLCFVLVYPITTIMCGGPQPAGANRLAPTEKCFTCRNGSLYPRIYDGAALNFLSRHSGGNNATLFWGDLTFAWGNT
jgi:hypothetical protein